MAQDYANSSIYKPHEIELNAEQLRHLLEVISSDEHNEIKTIARGCAREMTLKYGIPFSFGVTGTLYYARTRLPPKYHFGPKGWPFYFMMGFASLTAANIFTMGNCRNRLRPRISELWIKYNNSQPNTFEEVRQTNRQRDRTITEKPPTKLYNLQDQSSEYTSYNSDVNQSNDLEFKSYDLLEKPRRETREQPHQNVYYEDIPAYMSGTPSGPKHDTFKDSTFS
uniref:OCIA domain-containing protein n=1 Tax=Heterorhabditis bacteriophora TaxID=37862 RepID=A0A1I7X9I9_HETBA